MTACPGSGERWPAIRRGTTAGWRAAATSAAEPVMKPSRTTGIRAAAARGDDADQHADLQPADGREDADRVRRVRPVDLDRPLDGRDLAAVPVRVDARAATGHAFGGPSGQHRGDRARRRRVADTHLAEADEVEPAGAQLVHEVQADPRSPGAPRPATSPGPRSCRPCPSRMRAWTRRPPRAASRSAAGIGPATPTSTTTTVAPTSAASTLIAAPPATKLATIWAVTSDG